MFYIMITDDRAIGIGDKDAKLILLFTEHTGREVGESVCRFLNDKKEIVDAIMETTAQELGLEV